MTKPRLFQVIDLDRTLFDTARFAQAILDEIDILHPGTAAELREQFQTAYQREETFFLLRYLRYEKGDEWFEELVNKIVEKYSANAFLLPDVHKRLAFAQTLTNESPAWGILTYGDEVDQRLKLRIIGLEDAPVYLAYTPNKAEILQSWQTEDGTFQLPEAFGGHTVDMITLEDDKHRAFIGIPKGVLGIWMTARTDAVDDLGETVVRAKDMAESMRVLRKTFL